MPASGPVLQQVGQLDNRAHEDCGIAAVGPTRELVQAGFPTSWPRLQSSRCEHDQVSQDREARQPTDRFRERGRPVPPLFFWAPSASFEVTKTTSALATANRYAPVEWARAVTKGCPCGGRGVIDGP